MSEFRGTPGPWVQDKYGHVRQANGDSVVFGGITLGLSSNDEIRANDRLVGASLDLLEALQMYLVEVPINEVCDYADMCKTKARAAIAKALGASNAND